MAGRGALASNLSSHRPGNGPDRRRGLCHCPNTNCSTRSSQGSALCGVGDGAPAALASVSRSLMARRCALGAALGPLPAAQAALHLRRSCATSQSSRRRSAGPSGRSVRPRVWRRALPAALLTACCTCASRHRHTLLAQVLVHPGVRPTSERWRHTVDDAPDQLARQHLRTVQAEQTWPNRPSASACSQQTDVRLRYVKPLGHLLLSHQRRPPIPRPPAAPCHPARPAGSRTPPTDACETGDRLPPPA